MSHFIAILGLFCLCLGKMDVTVGSKQDLSVRTCLRLASGLLSCGACFVHSLFGCQCENNIIL